MLLALVLFAAQKTQTAEKPTNISNDPYAVDVSNSFQIRNSTFDTSVHTTDGFGKPATLLTYLSTDGAYHMDFTNTSNTWRCIVTNTQEIDHGINSRINSMTIVCFKDLYPPTQNYKKDPEIDKKEAK